MVTEYRINGYDKNYRLIDVYIKAENEFEAGKEAIKTAIFLGIIRIEENRRYDYLCEEPIYK